MDPNPVSSGTRTSWLFPLYAFVFISGASGLMYEIVWIRALGRHFGISAPAISTVLAAFMAGLALGNFLIGRLADRSLRPLLLYRWLEVGIGLFGLGGSLVLLHGDVLLDAMARLTVASGVVSGVVRFLFATLLLLVPATLMGGTLPVLARGLVSTGVSGRVVGSLYALNTAGAVAGALVPDLLLIPRLGLTATVMVAAAGNLLVALGVGRIESAASLPPPSTRSPGRMPWRALTLFAVSGFSAMGAEVLWSRLLEHWVAGLVTSFSVLLAVFLIFLAAGSWLTRNVADRVSSPLSWAACLLVLSAVAVLLPLVLAEPWLEIKQGILGVPGGVHRPALLTVLGEAALHAIYLEGAACLLFGASFPFLAAATVRQGSAGRETGMLYAVNTLAGVGGSIVAGFLLLPILGLQLSFLLLAGMAAVAGLGVAASLGREGRWFAGVALLGCAFIAVFGFGLPLDHLRRAHFSGRRGEIVSIYEGATTTAAVVKHYWYGQFAYMELQTPGVTMSATNLESRRYMGMMGHLGMFLASEPRSALLICYGVGNTASSLLSHPDLARLDVVDIAREVLDSSPEFASELGLDPLAEPRVQVYVDDGRHHLVTAGRRYDVITSEPPPPNHAGVVNLYSREYYRLARSRLEPGGVLTQWLPVFQLAEEETASIVAAFVAEFPHTALFLGWGYQWILVGSEQPLAIDLEDWNQRAALPPVARDLTRIGVDGVGDLVGSFLQNDAGLRMVGEDVRPVTDDYPVIQYPWRELAGATEVPDGLVGDPAAVEELLVSGAASLAEYRPHMDLTRNLTQVLQWWRLEPNEWWELWYGTGMRLALASLPDHDSSLALLEVNDERVARAMEALADGSRKPGAALTLIRRAFYLGEYGKALAGLEAMGPQGVNPAQYWMLWAGCARALGRSDEAAEAFRKAAQASDSDRFRNVMAALSENAAVPYAAEMGPLSVAPEGGEPTELRKRD